MLEVLRADYITLARMKGLNEYVVITKHALRNALIPTVTVIGLQIGMLLGGNMIIETIFGWPGLGRTLVRAVSANDFPVAQGAFLFIAIIMVLMNFLADFLYGVLDPRVGSSFWLQITMDTTSGAMARWTR